LPGNGRSILTVSLASGAALTSARSALEAALAALFLRAGGAADCSPVAGHRRRGQVSMILTINWLAGTHLHSGHLAGRGRRIARGRRLTDLGGDLRLGLAPRGCSSSSC
jgi:hypothetical protein